MGTESAIEYAKKDCKSEVAVTKDVHIFFRAESEHSLLFQQFVSHLCMCREPPEVHLVFMILSLSLPEQLVKDM